jgi:hypothetical protein
VVMRGWLVSCSCIKVMNDSFSIVTAVLQMVKKGEYEAAAGVRNEAR